MTNLLVWIAAARTGIYLTPVSYRFPPWHKSIGGTVIWRTPSPIAHLSLPSLGKYTHYFCVPMCNKSWRRWSSWSSRYSLNGQGKSIVTPDFAHRCSTCRLIWDGCHIQLRIGTGSKELRKPYPQLLAVGDGVKAALHPWHLLTCTSALLQKALVISHIK